MHFLKNSRFLHYKLLALGGLLLLTANAAFCATINFTFQNVLKTNIDIGLIPLTSFENKVYYLNEQPYSDKIAINAYNVLTQQITAFTIKNTDTLNDVEEIEINKDFLVVHRFHSIAVYQRFGAKYAYYFTEKIDFDNVRLLTDNRLVLFRNYNAHPSDYPYPQKTSLAIFDLKAKKIVRQAFPVFDNIYFTHLIGSFIDVHPSGKIAMTQTATYNFKIYDPKFQIVSEYADNSLRNDSGTLRTLEVLNINKRSGPVKPIIEKVAEADEDFNRIERIHFLNDNTILIIKKVKDKRFEYKLMDVFDISFRNAKKIVSNFKYDLDYNNFSNESVEQFPVVWGNSANFHIGEGWLFFSETYVPYKKGTIKDLEKSVINYLENNPEKKGVHVYRFAIN